MFVPEAALSLAINNDWDLQLLAMQTKMGFVTPINLIPILRMAESLWRQDRINENAEAIAIQFGKFIDKFNASMMISIKLKDILRMLMSS